VEVQNFGQVPSTPVPLGIVCHIDGREVAVASGKVPALDPFEKTVVELPWGNLFKPGVSYKTSVMIQPDGQRPVMLEGSINLVKEVECGILTDEFNLCSADKPPPSNRGA